MTKKRHILFLRFHDEAHIDFLAGACRERGHRVEVIEVSESERLERALNEASFDMVFTHNLYVFDQRGEEGKILEERIKALQRPFVAWYVDSPFATGSMQRANEYLFGPFPKHIQHWVIDSGWLPALRERGLSAEYFPLAVGEAWLNTKPNAKSPFAGQITYVGKPWEDLDRDLRTPEDREKFFMKIFLEEFLAFARQKSSAFGLSEADLSKAREIVGAALQPLFQTMGQSLNVYHQEERNVLERLKGPLVRPLYALFLLLQGRMAMIFSNGQMADYLSALQPLGLEAYGSDRWHFYLQSSQSRRLSDGELKDCFASAALSFCYTKQQFINAIHERPLLVFGAGGFALADDKADLLQAWGHRPDFVYGSKEEACEKVSFYLKNPSHRETSRQKARAWILKSMTYRQRAEDFEKLMETLL